MKWKPKSPPKDKPWQLQEAKAKLSHVIALAQSQGDQTITRHGKRAGIIVSPERYDKLTGATDRPSLIEALLACPKYPEFRIPRHKNDVVGRERPLFD